MRKNKREVILDFTSLLDVIMLILFFFVIFAQIDSSNAIDAANQNAEQAIADADQAIQDANQAIQDAMNDQALAEAMMSEAEQEQTYAQAVILNSTGDFDKAIQLQLDLLLEDEKWKIVITGFGKDNKPDAIIEDVRNRKPDELADELDKIISNHSYSPSDAILINLVYDSMQSGSRKSKTNSDEMIRLLRDEYHYQYLFSTTVDTSKKESEESQSEKS